MGSKKISQLQSGSLTPPLSGVTAVVYSGTTYQQELTTLRQILVDSGSHNFTGSQTFNGIINVNGYVDQHITTLDNNDLNFITVSGSIINGVEYNNVRFSLTDFDDPSLLYNKSFIFEYFDSKQYGYGSEISINGMSTNMSVFSSGSSRVGRLNIKDLGNDNTLGDFYADEIRIGAFSGSTSIGITIGHEDVPNINYNSIEHNFSGNVNISGSNTFVGDQTIDGYTILSNVSSSLDFVDDSAASLGGVPLGGLYRSGSFVLIRLT
jgi:hypothetical protein